MEEAWSLSSVFDARVKTHPEQALLVAAGRTLSYAQVQAQSRRLAAALAGLGIEAGDRIAINMPNTAEWVVALLAGSYLGATIVPVNPRLNYHELRYQLRHAEVSVAFTIERFGDTDFLQIFESLITELPDLHYVVTAGVEDLWYDDRIFQFEDLITSVDGGDFVRRQVDENSPLAVVYTSGTLGKPKGVRLSHRTLVECSSRAAEAMGVVPGDRVLCAVPMSGIFGFTVATGAISSGATLVLQETFDARGALQLIQREKVSVLYGVPTMYQLLMRELAFDFAMVRNVRIGAVAGGPVTEELVRRVRRWCDLQVAYGLTETGPTVSITRASDPPEKRLTSVGRPLPGVEVRAIDPATHEPLEAGGVGVIAVRGFNVMSGYERMPSETARSFTSDGFFLTGDLGFVDDEGFLHIVGRSREVILRGGYQVYPREVEEPLNAHPAVDDVCVIGVPQEILGELICACIVPVEGAVITGEEIKDFARTTMAAHKVPDMVRFFSSFPTTRAGQVKRRELERTVLLEHTATTGSS